MRRLRPRRRSPSRACSAGVPRSPLHGAAGRGRLPLLFLAVRRLAQRAFANERSPIVIGVFGNDPFDGSLDQAVAGERVNGRPIVVRRLKTRRGGGLSHSLHQLVGVAAAAADPEHAEGPQRAHRERSRRLRAERRHDSLRAGRSARAAPHQCARSGGGRPQAELEAAARRGPRAGEGSHGASQPVHPAQAHDHAAGDERRGARDHLRVLHRLSVRELSRRRPLYRADVGELVASNSTGAVAFDNPSDEKEVLAALHAERRIRVAAVYDTGGNLSRNTRRCACGRVPAAPEARRLTLRLRNAGRLPADPPGRQYPARHPILRWDLAALHHQIASTR